MYNHWFDFFYETVSVQNLVFDQPKLVIVDQVLIKINYQYIKKK